jgi:diadenosine tetraphosphate (Ap4A) HIT family hydrolase
MEWRQKMSTIFDKIVSGEIPSYTVWEDDNYMAFLTPFPNTPGFTVVIPKINPGDYVFGLDDEVYHGLLDATKKVANLLEKAFNTSRVALVFEGTGVAHVHAKLIPLHGPLANETNVWSKHTEFNPEYTGHITTVEGPKMDDAELSKIQAQIKAAA